MGVAYESGAVTFWTDVAAKARSALADGAGPAALERSAPAPELSVDD